MKKDTRKLKRAHKKEGSEISLKKWARKKMLTSDILGQIAKRWFENKRSG